MNQLIVDSLHKAGYTNVTHTENGQKAYDFIMKCKTEGTLDDFVQCVITDIEMPLMDGHRLTKLLRDDDTFKNLPIVIFSSLINDEMRRKGEALGSNAQLSKPEIGKLVSTIDSLVMDK